MSRRGVAEIFADEAIFSTVRRELSWSYIKTLMYLNDSLKREFYIEMARQRLALENEERL